MILGITPARGGSKGIPRKNIQMIAGKPLLSWTIEQAKQSKMIGRYVVSTEDIEIAEVARKFGAEILERPKNLATDEADTLDVLQHALDRFSCDVVVLLQATSPIRAPGRIDECINEFLEKKCDSLATGFICDYVEYSKSNSRRQDISGFFYDDGNIYVMKADNLKLGDRYGKKICRKFTSRWENVDIDDDYDLWVAEKILMENRVK